MRISHNTPRKKVCFNNLIQKIKLPFRKDKELYLCLYAILGFYPKNIAYYKQALMHKSVSVKGKDGRYQNNERLEFLGDAILDAIVGDIVYRHFENKREGFLTNARSKIVQRETLGKLAKEIGLDKLIQSNQHHNNSHNSYMAGNAFEALVGAIYLDYGYKRCMSFMEKRILNQLIDIDKVAYKEVNFKSKLLEWSQKNRIRLEFKDMPQTTDKNGLPMFLTQVVIEGLDCGRGKGYSKKESQQNAAQETLIMLKKQKGFEEKVFEAKSRRTAMEEQPEALLPEIPEELLVKKQTPQPPKQTPQPPKGGDKPVSGKKEKSELPKKEKPQATATPATPSAVTTDAPLAAAPDAPSAAAPDVPTAIDPINEVLDAIDSITTGTDNAETVAKPKRHRGSRRKSTSLGAAAPQPNTEQV